MMPMMIASPGIFPNYDNVEAGEVFGIRLPGSQWKQTGMVDHKKQGPLNRYQRIPSKWIYVGKRK